MPWISSQNTAFYHNERVLNSAFSSYLRFRAADAISAVSPVALAVSRVDPRLGATERIDGTSFHLRGSISADLLPRTGHKFAHVIRRRRGDPAARPLLSIIPSWRLRPGAERAFSSFRPRMDRLRAPRRGGRYFRARINLFAGGLGTRDRRGKGAKPEGSTATSSASSSLSRDPVPDDQRPVDMLMGSPNVRRWSLMCYANVRFSMDSFILISNENQCVPNMSTKPALFRDIICGVTTPGLAMFITLQQKDNLSVHTIKMHTELSKRCNN